jgi:hypothetical protein
MLYEYQPGSRLDRSHGLPQRVAHGLLWALAWWLAGALALAVVAGTVISVHTLWPKSGVKGKVPSLERPGG